ncbi:MAG: triose-phosphate isomerase family protein [Candidatus Limnocylindrales bacterium]
MATSPPAATRPLVGAGLKMNLTASEAGRYFDVLRPRVAGISGCDLFVLPPFTAIAAAREHLAGSNIAWGAQDVHPQDSGPFTGDISMPMLADLGCTYVEVGHVERRRAHGETGELIAAKVAQVLRHGATPILCVGEPEPVGMPAASAKVVAQLRVELGLVAPADRAGVVIAYEPTWAIGQAATAAPEYVAGVVHAIRAWLASDDGGRATPRIIYGGSVNLSDVGSLLREADVDGLFVGRAALDPERFAAIAGAVQAARATTSKVTAS